MICDTAINQPRLMRSASQPAMKLVNKAPVLTKVVASMMSRRAQPNSAESGRTKIPRL